MGLLYLETEGTGLRINLGGPYMENLLFSLEKLI